MNRLQGRLVRWIAGILILVLPGAAVFLLIRIGLIIPGNERKAFDLAYIGLVLSLLAFLRRTPPEFRPGIICLILLISTALIYERVLECGFTNYDDPNYIVKNSHVTTGLSAGNVAWAFTTGHASNWHPLTWISHMLDCQLFGLNPAGHHLANLLFHLFDVLLLFAVMRRMTGALWRSACVAALFAWHPLHVESVAWLSERKDVLSALFWLLAMWTYLGYVKRLAVRDPGAKSYYALTLFFFVCGLMSKPMVVTLPFAFLLMDYWPLARIPGGQTAEFDSGTTTEHGFGQLSFSRAVLEKTPMLALALAASVVTFLVQQHGGAVSSLETIPLPERAENALVAYVRYLGKLFCPANLSIYYPFQHDLPAWQWAGAILLLAAISWLAIAWRQRHPFFITGWLWFVGTLVPVIGLVQVGMQSMADRYMYLPSIGLFIAVVWGAGEIIQRRPVFRIPAMAAGTAALAACVVLTVVQTAYWRNSITLFSHAILVTKDNVVAYVNLGEAYDAEGRSAEAKQEFMKALQINPESASTLNGMGAVYAHGGNRSDAVKYFESALRKQPFFGDAHYNLGNVLAGEGKYAEAAEQYAEAVRAKPESADAHNNLGAMLFKLGRLDEAKKEFQLALKANPDLAEAEDDLGALYMKEGKLDEARKHYAEAVRIDPNSAHAQNRLGFLMAKSGRIDLAVPHLLKAAELEPANSAAFRDLAAAYAGEDQLDKAVAAYEQAVKLDPGDAAARSLLGVTFMRQGNDAAAIQSFHEALKLNPDLPGALRNLAWILATCPKAELRNGPEALQLAERVNKLTDSHEPRLLEALDVALAETGRFDEAIKTAEQVKLLATTAGDTATANAAANRIELYRAGKPYREKSGG